MLRYLPATLLLFVTSPLSAADDGLDFFEQKIRPVFVEHCFKCHSTQTKSQKGGLLLDSREAMLAGGDSGPAIVPGKPEMSLLIKAIGHRDESLKMPPKAKLPDAIIADLTKWITIGAPHPKVIPSKIAVDPEVARKHWAFQPIKKYDSTIDAFIVEKLKAKRLALSPLADKRTLIRRATFDLIGLPPTPEEIDAFIADLSPDAFVKVIDRLLASPAYGERWGRHWLDIARFADTKDGVLMYGDDRVRPYAYTYRDYVIRAFNDDTPFDRFVHEQLAADQLDLKGETWRLAGMGFLTLGRQFDNNIHDVIDDRIDTMTRGFVGLTVSCARCHDHKYDPIPTADYYSLYGVFAASESPIELPLLNPMDNTSEFEKQAAPKREELRKFIDTQYALLREDARMRVGEYLVRVTQPADPLETAIFFLSLAPTDLRPQIIVRWRQFIAQRATPNDPIFAPWHDLMKSPENEFEAVRTKWRERTYHPLVREAWNNAKLTTYADVARMYGELLKNVYVASKQSPMLSPEQRQFLEMLTSADSPAYFPKTRLRDYLSRQEKDGFGGKIQEIDNLAVKSKNAPPRAMVLVDAEQRDDPRIFHRGDASRPTERVPRRFLQVVAGEKRQPFANGSGRLDLAKAITATDNPLTARVMVNRVWMHHFGEPLVENPSDFGLRTPPPTHPELLDHLASEFVANGWSLKNLHRTIMLSNVYQQQSFDRADCRTIDPENRTWWRQNRRRLDFESMRDAMLMTSGRLQRTMLGRPVDVANDPNNARRTIYGLVDRQSLPGVFRAFDFANPDQSSERRVQTTVPQQAMFGMNSPFVMQQARSLMLRAEIANEKDAVRRIAMLYRVVLGREPQPREMAIARAFVEQPIQGSKLAGWEQFAQVLLLTNEFMFVE